MRAPNAGQAVPREGTCRAPREAGTTPEVHCGQAEGTTAVHAGGEFPLELRTWSDERAAPTRPTPAPRWLADARGHLPHAPAPAAGTAHSGGARVVAATGRGAHVARRSRGARGTSTARPARPQHCSLCPRPSSGGAGPGPPPSRCFPACAVGREDALPRACAQARGVFLVRGTEFLEPLGCGREQETPTRVRRRQRGPWRAACRASGDSPPLSFQWWRRGLGSTLSPTRLGRSHPAGAGTMGTEGPALRWPGEDTGRP